MITEQQVNDFERKAKDDALKAFNELLQTHKSQLAHIADLNQNIRRSRDLMEKWALEAGYKVNWDVFMADFHAVIGDCMECRRKNVGIRKYSDFKGGYMVCDPCMELLHNQLDNYEN
jgi:hypothetical protein